MASDGPVGALVLLRTADGRRPEAADLTASRIEALLPEPQVVEGVSAFFADAGFDAGPVAGLTLPITGPPDAFESTLGVPPVGPGEEYPLDRLPEDVRRSVAAVTAPAALDFGPGAW
jgi:hypothetical protein